MNDIDRTLKVADYCDKDADTVTGVYPTQAKEYRADAQALRNVVAELQALRVRIERLAELVPVESA